MLAASVICFMLANPPGIHASNYSSFALNCFFNRLVNACTAIAFPVVTQNTLTPDKIAQSVVKSVLTKLVCKPETKAVSLY